VRGWQKPSNGERPAAHPDVVQFQMQNVNFRVSQDVVLEVRALRGSLESTKNDIPITLDDADSFVVNIDSAQVAITPQSLTSLMNSYVLAYENAPIKNVTVSIEQGRLIQKGTVHKGVDLPFEIEGSMSATPDGNIRIHAEKIKSAHLPVKGLLHLLGEDLSKLVKQNAGRGMTVAGDDIILTPQTLTPPPHLIGHVTKVSIVEGKIVQVFGSGRTEPPLTPPLRSTSYIYHRGGVLRFGKLTMNDADLEIVGDRPGVFDFFQREYQRQLVAGYSKSTSSKGLIAHMVDYSRLSATTRGNTRTVANGRPTVRRLP
jgi:hypothetical protein